ncbi:uncharacterized protein LOC130243131 [Danio aesculapii]|uniref:uncharacterized protein LOC130243131 n=1 Tax=Danio aesculapii TaxID=1142201 RepID=UPI0024C0C365|nr:uncharacterized protein LOC130243131 [Danio aesculapii]
MGSLMLVWILSTAVILMPVFLDGAISIHFKTGRTLHVALGQSLVLEAVFDKNPDDKIDMVTWDRQSKGVNVRLSGTQGGRISLEKGDALLRITNVSEDDFGVYKVTVTDSNGYQQYDSIEVQRIEKPPRALTKRVLECVLEKHDMMQWDTPQFSWMIDGITVTNETTLIANGSRLDISEVKGVNYTCIIKSSLGTVTTHYEIPKESESQPCCKGLVAVIIVAIAAAVVVVIGLILWRKNQEYTPTQSQ